ncbi:MAG: CDP-diacylglycerol--serine O-phosphatidyltransferase [Thermoplasmata archaeon]|nr:MAG: CDP-diacylglycerol--serine O-phosphatidyltransferase [Thermoplasmata archaeon]
MMLKQLKVADIFSILNATFGFGGILYLFKSGINANTFYFLYLSSFMDGADGIAANRFGKSPFGKDLDSLADSISFGLFPSLILVYNDNTLAIPALIFVIASILRLARFNVIEAENFVGFPTVASALLLTSLIRLDFALGIIFIVTVFLAFLMISDIEYVKIRNRALLLLLGFVILLCFFVKIAVYILLLLTLIYLISPVFMGVVKWKKL